MKLLSLSLLAYGCFTDARLEFGEDGGGFHVIHGANEAGKSTAMRALTNLLFEIPARTRDAHRHEMGKLRIGGEALASTGARLAFTRRKGNSRTLLDAVGEPLPDSALAPFLGGAVRETFETVYRLDHAALIAGGADLLAGRGDLAQSLFQAASGMSGVRRALAEIDEEAAEIFKLGGSKAHVNSALARYREAQRAVKAASFRPSEWNAAVEGRDRLAALVAEFRRSLEANRARLRKLEWGRAACPHARKRAALLAEQSAMGLATLLPTDAARRRENAEAAEKRATEARDQAEKDIARLRKEFAALETAPGILKHARSITELNQRLREYRTAIAELPDASHANRDVECGREKLARLDDEIAVRLQRLGKPSGGIKELERLPMPSSETVERFESAFALHNGKREKLDAEIASVREQIERDREKARAVEIGGPIPSEAELIEARRCRDERWRLLLLKWDGIERGQPELPVILASGEGETMETSYSDSVRHADLVADRLRCEVDRVAAHTGLLAAIGRGTARCALLERRLSELIGIGTALQSEWVAAWAPAKLTPGPPREMGAWLQRHAELLRLACERRETAGAIASETARLRMVAEAFVRETRELCAKTAPEIAGEPADRAVETLHARLTQALKDEGRRQELVKSIAAAEKALSEAGLRLETARREMGSLFAQAGCADRAALLDAEARSERSRKLIAQIEAENGALLDLSESAPIEEFAAEAASLDCGALDGEIALLRRSIANSDAALAEHQRALGEAEARVKSMDAGAGAAGAAEEAEAALAEARQGAEQYAGLCLAAAILRGQAERYRQENQDPVLRRASTIFAGLTLGSFAGIVTDFRETDTPMLLGVRPSGEEVDVAGMSEGTRDQLYLALRIATLERHLQSGEPMPFVVDDILVSFDDARARAALTALSALCARVQILFFTHHPHLVELARQSIPAGLLHEHRLPA